MVLVISASMLANSFLQLRRTSPGFRVEGLYGSRIALPAGLTRADVTLTAFNPAGDSSEMSPRVGRHRQAALLARGTTLARGQPPTFRTMQKQRWAQATLPRQAA